MKTVLVTGATGALGQAVVANMRKDRHWRVVATSRQCQVEGSFQLDIRDHENFSTVIKSTKPDLVVHLTAIFANDFDDAYAVNVDAARHLLEVVKNAKCPVLTVH